MKARGLVYGELIDHFRLGYADRTLGYRLPEKNRKAGEALRGQLQRLGVLRESGHEHLSGSLVIPILGEDGAVLGMYGRKITPNLRKGTPLHLYLPGPHRGVFNVQALKESREVILCEALIDALTFWCAGFVNVTSAYGVEGFTNEYWEALERYGVDRVYIAYDRDDAGNQAAQQLGEQMGKRGIEALRVLFPRGMDANQYALKVTPADQALGAVLRGARWIAGPTRRLRTMGVELTAPEVWAALQETKTAEPKPVSEPAAAAAQLPSAHGGFEGELFGQFRSVVRGPKPALSARDHPGDCRALPEHAVSSSQRGRPSAFFSIAVRAAYLSAHVLQVAGAPTRHRAKPRFGA
jgi:DNA primase